MISFIALIVGRGILFDQLRKVEVIHVMYDDLSFVSPKIFNDTTGYCYGQIRVQDCPANEKKEIYKHGIPSDGWVDLAAFAEAHFECNGFDNHILAKFCFTDYRKLFLYFIEYYIGR